MNDPSNGGRIRSTETGEESFELILILIPSLKKKMIRTKSTEGRIRRFGTAEQG